MMGDWPGLAEGDLYDGRDLMPACATFRAYAAWAMHAKFGGFRATLEGLVFPDWTWGPTRG